MERGREFKLVTGPAGDTNCLTAYERRKFGRWGSGLPGTALTQIAEEKGRCWTLGYNVLGPEAIPKRDYTG